MNKTSDNTVVITIPDGARAEMDGRTIKIIFNDMSTVNIDYVFNRMFPIIPASQLSLEDDFMKFEPTYKDQQYFKKLLKRAIDRGLEDFRVSAIDPSFNGNDKIFYKAGLMPAVGKCADWWYEKLEEFMPEKGSRMGTKTEYFAFLGYLIKYLVNNGWRVPEAWYAVCCDSKKLGHYRNSKNAKDNFEPTGSRPVGLFFDLANTGKILVNDYKDTWMLNSYLRANTNYTFHGGFSPLANLCETSVNDLLEKSTGWLVLDV